MVTQYPGNRTIDLRNFNKQCKENGYDPFPFSEITVLVQDEHHDKLTIQLWEKHILDWWRKEGHKKLV